MRKGAKRKGAAAAAAAAAKASSSSQENHKEEDEQQKTSKAHRAKRVKASKPETEPEYFEDQRNMVNFVVSCFHLPLFGFVLC